MKINFIARDPAMYEIAPRPFPSAQSLPDWWKSMTPYAKSPDNPDGKRIIVEDYLSNATFKKCVPMLDALTSGYILPLWSDIQVRQVRTDNDSFTPFITWRVKKDVFELHGSESHEIKQPEGYSTTVFKYLNPWIPRTPKGYSTLVTQPFGYHANPFYAVPAIVDTDTSTLDILPPMWIKEGFEGIIEKGTPMVQLTPFKRDNWTSEFSHYKEGEINTIQDKNFGSTLVNHYVKNHWAKKKYK